MLYKILDKSIREMYRLLHPMLWGKGLQINGIPVITNYGNLKLGKDVSINRDVYIQCSSEEVIIGNNVTLSKGCSILTEGIKTNHYIQNAQKKYRPHIKKSGYW